MTVEQLMIKLWKMPSDAKVTLVYVDGTEEVSIHDFSVKRENDEVHLIEKSFQEEIVEKDDVTYNKTKENEIFIFAEAKRKGPVAIFYDCILNQQVGMYEKGAYIPKITINVETLGMSFFNDNNFIINHYTLKQTLELAW